MLVSWGEAASPCSPAAWGRSQGREGLVPNLPPSSWDATSLFPPLLPAEKASARLSPPAWGSRAFTVPALRCLLHGICSSSSPCSPGLWDGAACLPFQMGRVQFRQKKLATSQCCYFCSFYSELGIGLRKRSDAHQRVVCGCWRANHTSELQQTFGSPLMGIQ